MSGNDSHTKGSYDRHSEHEAQMVEQGQLPSCYTMPNSVDAWRHRRMHNLLLPLIRETPNATWLTIGDGNYASDAYFLCQEGADVIASSLTVASLQTAKELGYVSRIASVNAEMIEYPDDSFDFVLCKESYHHFPRPAIAYYEMLRVAREAVILIEPYEGNGRVLSWMKVLIKRFIRGTKNIEQFEHTGNFIYRISQRETEKMLTALNYCNLAIRRFNDCYLSWASTKNRPRSWGFCVTFAGVAFQDILCNLGLLDHGLAAIISFKRPLKQEIRKGLKDVGFKVIDLPRNPYL
jgi:SAM-dependent methyltransferase